jgi:hypothetical protein
MAAFACRAGGEEAAAEVGVRMTGAGVFGASQGAPPAPGSCPPAARRVGEHAARALEWS